MSKKCPTTAKGLVDHFVERAFRMILKYFDYIGEEERGNVIRDLLADLMHYCDQYGIDFENELRIAQENYRGDVYDAEREIENVQVQ